MPIPTPNGERTFNSPNGHPISGGTVYTYVPGTTNPSPTYADEQLTVENPNPITLDQAGRCVMWTGGLVRQVVYDMFGNLQWDQETGFSLDPYIGNLTIEGNLTVDGSSTFNGPTQTNGNANISGSLGVGGGANIAGGADITGGLTTDGIHNTGNLQNDGNANINGSLTVAGPTDANGGLTTNNLQVNGNADITGTATVGGLHDTGNAQIDGNLNVNGTITSGGGGGGGGATPQITPVRIVNPPNGGSIGGTASDGLIIVEFSPGSGPNGAESPPAYTFNETLPANSPTGQVLSYKIGLGNYNHQTGVGGAPLVTINFMPPGGGSIDGVTSTTPPDTGGGSIPATEYLPYVFSEGGVGPVVTFVCIGEPNWVITTGYF